MRSRWLDRGPRQSCSVNVGEPTNMDIRYLLASVLSVAALLAGILILVMPKLLNYIVALYLIIIGLVGLFGR